MPSLKFDYGILLHVGVNQQVIISNIDQLQSVMKRKSKYRLETYIRA